MFILSVFTFVIVHGVTQGAKLGKESARTATQGASFLGKESREGLGRVWRERGGMGWEGEDCD